MPWSHCGRAIKDNEPRCPTCGSVKHDWTIIRGNTRVLQVTNAWIELELVDDDGEPAAGVAYQVELPTGALRQGDLNEAGFVRLERIPPGVCRVSFPDRDVDDVVALPPRRAIPPKGATGWIELELA